MQAIQLGLSHLDLYPTVLAETDASYEVMIVTRRDHRMSKLKEVLDRKKKPKTLVWAFAPFWEKASQTMLSIHTTRSMLSSRHAALGKTYQRIENRITTTAL